MHRMSLVLIGFLAASVGHAAAPPNIVMVFIDDMGWGDLSCFGGTRARTEHIDRLAADGLRFEQFYVNSPICSPSRVALSTGQYPQRWRINSYLADRQRNQQRGIANWLDPKAPMLARILAEAGYATGHFGKWHMGGQRDVGDAPLITVYGFEASLTNFEGLGPRVLPLLEAYKGRPAHRHALGSDKLGRGPIRWEQRSRVTASFVDAALAFIDQSQERQVPFYINLWPDDVHSPFFPPKRSRGNETKSSLYLGVLETMDEQLALLFDRIRDDPRLRDNTLILVCSDNGPERGAGSAGPFRGSKAMLYEGGIRSPLICWGPRFLGSEVRGQVNTTSVFSAIDLAPTLLDIVGIESPANYAPDGEVLTGTLLGKSQESRMQPLYFRRPPDRDSYSGVAELPDLAVRSGRWKLLCEYDGSDMELYDVTEDVGESKNLAADHLELAQRLAESLVAWHKSLPADAGATFASD